MKRAFLSRAPAVAASALESPPRPQVRTRPQAVSSLPHSFTPIAGSAGPPLPGSLCGSRRSGPVGEGFKPSPTAPAAAPRRHGRALLGPRRPPPFRPGAAPIGHFDRSGAMPSPSFRPERRKARSGEIFQLRCRVRSTALERFSASVEMTGGSFRSVPSGAARNE